MSDNLEFFTCPSCQIKQPMSMAWMLTKYSELECEKCKAPIKPIASSVPRINAIPGLLGGLLGIFLYATLYPVIGKWIFLPVFLFICIANCWVVSRSVIFEARTKEQ